MGKSQASIEQMRTYIKEVNPQVPDSVVKMIPLYIAEGTVEGVRGDIAFAQSCLETGDFTFFNSAVTFNQNNFCGLGVTKTGMKGNSFKTPAEGIRAQIQHLQAYASTDKLQNRCVDPRYTYVNRGCAEYVEHLGTHENPKSQGWASGQNYGQKIINILNSILSIKTEKENDIMNINTSFISNNNSYAGQTPVYIVIHNTDNYAKGANAKAHAKAQHDGNFKGYSAHVFVDDTEAYQALPYDRGAWHVGVNYGGRLFGTVNNRNAVGIEMCIIQIGSMRTPYSDPVAAKFQPSHLFNGSVADTYRRKISGFIVRSHEVYSFMPSVSPIISCQVPGIFIRYGLSIRAIVSYWETFQIAEHRCIGIFPACKNLFI